MKYKYIKPPKPRTIPQQIKQLENDMINIAKLAAGRKKRPWLSPIFQRFKREKEKLEQQQETIDEMAQLLKE